MWQQVLDNVIMMSRDFSETHTSQNGMGMKPWTVGTRVKRIFK